MKTTIDYLKFRTTSDPYKVLEALRPAFGTTGDLLAFGDQVQGKDGWKWRRSVRIAGDVRIAWVDYGGDHMRGVVRFDMSGDGCEWVQDWTALASIGKSLDQCFIKRLDLALTTYAGEVSHDSILAAHDRREFGTGGRHPHYREVKGSDPKAGRTIYVGKREAWKFLRCYEKGWEMLKDIPASVRSQVTAVNVPGIGQVDPGQVYRVEVEFKDADDKVIPWTAITDRDDYFAGAYPFCASLLPNASPARVVGLPSFGAEMALASALDNCRRSYGAVLRAAYEAYGGDANKVMEVLMSERPAQHLVEAGVLTLEHD
jgi:phage replication initiation protein